MIDENTVKECWEGNAETWTELVRSGFDKYRDFLNTPRFLSILPDVTGKNGLDIGCGEGTNTRMVAELGASMKAVDISATFIQHAKEAEARSPKGIVFIEASAQKLPFGDGAFDFVTAFMSLMDMADLESALREAFRVLKPSGFLQFSISHPCFDVPFRKKVFDGSGKEIAVQVGGYFDTAPRIFEWQFSDMPAEMKARLPKFKNPYIRRTLSEWFNLLVDTGFIIERVDEPFADDRLEDICPAVADTRIVPHFLIIRVRKPA